MDITRKYQSDFGKWYVQVPVNGQNTEFAFDHDPEPIEIAVAIARYEQSIKPAETTMSEVKFVTLLKDGVKLTGVHPDAVPAHLAIGWEVMEKPEKPVEVAVKAADNDTALQTGGRTAARRSTAKKSG